MQRTLYIAPCPPGLRYVSGHMTVREEELALLRSVLENATDFIARAAIDGTLLFINRVAPGLTVEDAVGRSVLDFVAAESHEAVLRALDRVARTGEPGTYECKGVGPHGSVSDYHTIVSPIREGDRVVALTLIARDVTAQKATERALRESDEKGGAGYEVLEAADGEAALGVLSAEGDAIDLVLLDESMPKLSGRGVLERMRARRVDVPVIAWTAHVGVMEGVRAVLNKPDTSATLLRAVRQVLDG
jgi:PAS domain S-box-containing protein